jgi:hypothetical protein
MLSIHIDSILRKNKITKNYYIGCFASDQIPKVNPEKFPTCFVLNTDESTRPGEHWIALFLTSPLHVEYFDSLGQWPPISEKIHQFLSQFPHLVHNGDIKVQSDLSSSCGEHVIYFIHMRCKGHSFKEILKRLTSTKTKPDILVKNFLKHLLNR